MKNFLLLFFTLTILNSCKNNSEKQNSETEITAKNFEKINQLQWLLGTWINENGEKYSQETWSKENDSTYTAFSFTQVSNETVFSESIALEQLGSELLFTATEVDQNDDGAVTFKFISSENGQFIFENKNHDFPERIIYTNPVKDSLHAWIEGMVDGKAKKVDFHFSRKN